MLRKLRLGQENGFLIKETCIQLVFPKLAWNKRAHHLAIWIGKICRVFTYDVSQEGKRRRFCHIPFSFTFLIKVYCFFLWLGRKGSNFCIFSRRHMWVIPYMNIVYIKNIKNCKKIKVSSSKTFLEQEMFVVNS